MILSSQTAPFPADFFTSDMSFPTFEVPTNGDDIFDVSITPSQLYYLLTSVAWQMFIETDTNMPS